MTIPLSSAIEFGIIKKRDNTIKPSMNMERAMAITCSGCLSPLVKPEDLTDRDYLDAFAYLGRYFAGECW
jgi:hypothetical protein